MVTEQVPERLSGYDTEDEYLATRYTQGERMVYTIDLSIPQLVATLPRPNPDLKIEGNRRITAPHAKAFSAYVLGRPDSVVPPLLLRCPQGVLRFEPLKQIGGSEWGRVEVPRLARDELKIVDGQHRALGFHMAWEQLNADMSAARDQLGAARRIGEQAGIQHAENKVREIENRRARVAKERVSLLIVVVDDPKEYRQIFVDIADNAKGITRTTRALFDSTRIVNRCLDGVMEHPLLRDRVDFDKDRVIGDNPNVMGAKHVADLIRTLEVGIAGRISVRLEDELREQDLVRKAKTFLDVLVDSFPDLAAIMDDSLTMKELRGRSLLGSVVMHRVLAGCYHELANGENGAPGMNRLQIQRYFEKLAPFMVAPVTDDSPWRRFTGDDFPEGAMAPRSPSQNLKSLTGKLTHWAIRQPDWLRDGRRPAEAAPAASVRPAGD